LPGSGLLANHERGLENGLLGRRFDPTDPAGLLTFGFACAFSPLLLRDRVEKSGTDIPPPNRVAMERIKPWVWRSGYLKTTPNWSPGAFASGY